MEKLEQEFKASGGKFEEFRIGDLFDIKTGSLLNSNILFNGKIKRISAKSEDNGVIGSYDTLGVNGARHYENFISVNFFGDVFYHPYLASVEMKVHVLKFKGNEFTSSSGLYVASCIKNTFRGKFGYGNQLSSSKLREGNFNIILPTLGGKISFAFMQSFIEELEAYLAVTGLKNYNLTNKEKDALAKFDEFSKWGGVASEYFTLDSLFDNIKQGRRLKKENQKNGLIPFVMSGVTNTGVVNYISNPVAKFPKNSITIDIFGNTFYRNYDFGAGDDTGVYWNESKKYPYQTMLYFATAISKSLFGKFSYGKKLRSSQSLKFKILLLVKDDNKPDYEFMNDFIKAVQKLVIKDVVLWADQKIEATKSVVAKVY
ncbi:restriction endonuclease subunit S [Campylobacter sp. RM16190]|uniref:restriction endonuclease subunit S n=1 Tax=Campylobacter sp. RM16190 TaxID=1705727 RepID=UPI0032E3F14A